MPKPTLVEQIKDGWRIVLPERASVHVSVSGTGEIATAYCADTLTWADLRKLRVQLADLEFSAVKIQSLIEL